MVGLPLGVGAVAVTEPEAEVPWPLTATARAAMRRRALENMTARNRDRPEMQWLVMDVRDLTTFEDGAFDVAIDKGTMDAMMTTKGDVWDPPQQVIDDCTKEVDEVLRVLRKGGAKFLYLTFGQPHFRRRYLTRPDTTLEIQQIGDAFHYYLYIAHLSIVLNVRLGEG